ncbi:hypothetical protein AHAS_Ahas10G0082600 [Arachis hypogaea]
MTASSSSTTITATTTTTILVNTAGGTILSCLSASVSAIAVATAVLGVALAAPAFPSQHDDNNVHVVALAPLVANVSQFYNDDATLRAPNLKLETTAL